MDQGCRPELFSDAIELNRPAKRSNSNAGAQLITLAPIPALTIAVNGTLEKVIPGAAATPAGRPWASAWLVTKAMFGPVGKNGI